MHEVVEDLAAREVFETAPELLAAQISHAIPELGEVQWFRVVHQ
jgi:hypothetical protein